MSGLVHTQHQENEQNSECLFYEISFYSLKFGLENDAGLQASLGVQNARCTGSGESSHAPILKAGILT